MKSLRLLLVPFFLIFIIIPVYATKPIEKRVTLQAVGSDRDASGFAATFFKQKRK